MFKLFTRKDDINPILLTLSTCFYVLKSKFPLTQYIKWITNFLSIVRNFNLVIYTEPKSYQYIHHLIDKNNTRIKIVFTHFLI
jgi:hypothetical protein